MATNVCHFFLHGLSIFIWLVVNCSTGRLQCLELMVLFVRSEPRSLSHFRKDSKCIEYIGKGVVKSNYWKCSWCRVGRRRVFKLWNTDISQQLSLKVTLYVWQRISIILSKEDLMGKVSWIQLCDNGSLNYLGFLLGSRLLYRRTPYQEKAKIKSHILFSTFYYQRQ